MNIRKRLINDMGRLKLDDLMEVLQELLDQPVPESKNYDKELKDIKEEVKKLEKELKYKADIPPKLEEKSKEVKKVMNAVKKVK